MEEIGLDTERLAREMGTALAVMQSMMVCHISSYIQSSPGVIVSASLTLFCYVSTHLQHLPQVSATSSPGVYGTLAKRLKEPRWRPAAASISP
jgi:hypothetical protein